MPSPLRREGQGEGDLNPFKPPLTLPSPARGDGFGGLRLAFRVLSHSTGFIRHSDDESKAGFVTSFQPIPVRSVKQVFLKKR